MNVLDWKVTRGNLYLGQLKTFTPGISQSKVIQKTLSGEVYVQTIGIGLHTADVTIFVDREQLALINEAEADGALVSIVYRDKVYHGLIEEAVEWTAIIPGEWYDGSFIFLIEQTATYVSEDIL